MNNNERLNLEILFGDLLDAANIENANALTLYAIDLHEILEQAIQDYADDNDFEDYDPSY